LGRYRDFKPLSYEEHCENAADLKKANIYLWRVWERCKKAYGNDNAINSNLRFLLPSILNSKMTKLLNLLDSEYLKVVSDEQFEEKGHVYFNNIEGNDKE